MKYLEKKICRCCGGTRLKKFLDLGEQPLANNFHDSNDDVLPEYPLKVNVCLDCWHAQLSVVVDPDEMFKDYAYVSGTTKTLRDFFNYTAEWHTKRYSFKSDKKPSDRIVLDIACNDGSQLDSFKALGWETHGIDPAENLFPIAASKGHHIYKGYWNKSTATKFPTPDVILAQNVFAHVDDALGFLLACKDIMDDKTVLHIMTSQRDMIINKEFDTVYHEHLSFFNINSMNEVVRRAGLRLRGLQLPDIHGGSYIFEITKPENDYIIFDDHKLTERFNYETDYGNLFKVETYDKFLAKADDIIQEFRYLTDDLRFLKYKLIGFGAAAKGMTLLNASKVKLDYIVDENILKQGKFTPGMNIPILAPHVLQLDLAKLAIVVLPWNFLNEIKEKVWIRRPKPLRETFVTAFPYPHYFDQ